MKILVKPYKYDSSYNKFDALLLPLKDYSVEYESYYSYEDICNIKKDFNKDIFVVINRMMFNKDIKELEEMLIKIDSLDITGIVYYDLSILELKRKLNLKTDLVWGATFMVTNYKTCNYYHDRGVKYAILSKEITIDEVLEIKEKSNIIPIYTMLSYPVVATSRRSLITNYGKISDTPVGDKLEIIEKISKEKYIVSEDKFGTTFRYGSIVNNLSVLDRVKDFPYLLFIEDGIDHDIFMKVMDNYEDIDLVNELVGSNTGFLNRKTIYKVKKDG